MIELGRRFKQDVINFLNQAIKHVAGRGCRFSSLFGKTLGESIFALYRDPLALPLEFKAWLKRTFHGQGFMAGIARHLPRVVRQLLDIEMSRCLLNIAKRSLPKLILSGVGLASKDTAGRVVCLTCFQSST